MRALSSAAVIAQATNRELVVIWDEDEHCSAPITALFQNKFSVWGFRPWILKLPNFVDVYNYMPNEGGTVADCNHYLYNHINFLQGLKGQALNTSSTKHIYVRSAFVLNHTASNWKSETTLIRGYIPSKPVLKIMQSFTMANPGFNIHHAVGLHIRMQQPEQEPIKLTPSTYTSSDISLIQKYRGLSNITAFTMAMDIVLAANSSTKFYVAIDEEENIVSLVNKYGQNKILFLKRDCGGARDAKCLQYALADVLLLAKTQYFISSWWSSFSELVSRFGGKNLGAVTTVLDMLTKNNGHSG